MPILANQGETWPGQIADARASVRNTNVYDAVHECNASGCACLGLNKIQGTSGSVLFRALKNQLPLSPKCLSESYRAVWSVLSINVPVLVTVVSTARLSS